MSSHDAAGRLSEANGELGEPKAHRDTSFHITLPPGVRRFTATFTLDPEPDQLPPNSPPAKSEAA